MADGLRLIVSGDWTASQMEDLLDGRFAPVAPAPDRAAMQVWRLYRRLRSAIAGGQPTVAFQ